MLGQHTYADRLAYVVSRVGGQRIEPARPKIGIVAEPATADAARRLVAAARRQNWRDAVLLLVGPAYASMSDEGDVRLVADRAALPQALENFDHVAAFHADDYYGEEYLTDLALATTFFRGDGLTKASFHESDGSGGLTLTADGTQYRPVAAATLRRSLVRTDLFKRTLADPAPLLAEIELEAGSFLSIDEFSYCEGAHTGDASFDGSVVTAVTSDARQPTSKGRSCALPKAFRCRPEAPAAPRHSSRSPPTTSLDCFPSSPTTG